MNPHLSAVSLAAYEERSYAEIESNEGFVMYGDDNLFPQYLIDLYHSSSSHNALCNTIGLMIYGEGFTPEHEESKMLFMKWKMDEELRKAVLDYKIQGGFALEVVWSLDRSVIADVRHLPFEDIRAKECNEQGEVEYYLYSKDWSDRSVEPKVLCTLSEAKKKEHPNQILYVKPFSVGSKYYPKPDYIGAVNYIELDKEISVYHVNNIKNGMSPSFMINFKNGVPDEEARRQIRMEIERELQGTGNAGKFVMNFSDNPDRAPEFVPFTLSDASEQYQFLSEEATAKIMVGHRVTSPMLFGVMVSGRLGGGNEMEEASILFDRQVIQPARLVFKQALNSLLRVCKAPEGIITEPKRETLSVDPLNTLMEYLHSVAEMQDLENWELVSEEEVANPMLEAEYLQKTNFSKKYAKPDSKSKKMDGGLYKVRYAYTTSLQPNSREFCREMVALSKRNLEYRYEDIQDMSDAGVNGQFAPKGKSKYNIFLHKGGAYCHHAWTRRVYFRKRNKSGQFLPNKGRKNDEVVGEAYANKDGFPFKDKNEWGQASTRPIDTPNRGKLN